jgi:hypothetical protein
MNIQTVVRNMKDGRLGVVVYDNYGCCSEDEVPVVYDGTTYFSGTDRNLLEVVGPENAVAEPKKCGAGRGAECCKFLVMGPGGFECQRFGEMRDALIFKSDMTAQRQPAELYPMCQLSM